MDARGRNDRLNTMLFVAALFHGIVILGVSFTASEAFRDSPVATSMDVVLLSREFDDRPDNSDATYLAQQNLAGTGNTAEDAAIRVAYGRDAAPVTPGPEQDGLDDMQQQRNPRDSTAEQLYARRPDAGALTEQQAAAELELQLRTGMAGTANSVEILAAPDMRTVLQGAQPRELIVSASTRESRIAAYLDGWKRRVERVGTMNFPRTALGNGAQRNPVLEVSILASGKLQEAIILGSSGSRELDMAAVDILRMAAPFDPFPEYLRNDYDALKFSYEWQFNAGTVGRMRVP